MAIDIISILYEITDDILIHTRSRSNIIHTFRSLIIGSARNGSDTDTVTHAHTYAHS